MIDIILDCALHVIELCDMRNSRDEILVCECACFKCLCIHWLAEACVEAEASDRREIVALACEHCIDELACILRGSDIAVAESLIDFDI